MSRVVCRTSIRPKLRNSSRFGPPIRFLRPSRSRARAKVRGASTPHRDRARFGRGRLSARSRGNRASGRGRAAAWRRRSPRHVRFRRHAQPRARTHGVSRRLPARRRRWRLEERFVAADSGDPANARPILEPRLFRPLHPRRGPFRTGARLYREQPCHRRAGVGSTRLEVQQRWPSAMKLMTAAREDGGGGARRSKGGAAS